MNVRTTRARCLLTTFQAVCNEESMSLYLRPSTLGDNTWDLITRDPKACP